MPRSHICPSCLTELARIRAVPDPHYGLPIVVCPGCSLASVRTRHPDQMFWREVIRTLRSIRMLIFKTFLLVTMTLLMLFATGVMVNAMERADTSTNGLMIIPSPFVFDLYGIFPAALLAISAGCVIRLAYGHHRALGSLAILYGSGFAVVMVFALYYLIHDGIRWLLGQGGAPGLPSMRDSVRFVGAFLAISVVAALGLVPASLLRAYVQRSAHRRYCRIRKNIRRRQSQSS